MCIYIFGFNIAPNGPTPPEKPTELTKREDPNGPTPPTRPIQQEYHNGLTPSEETTQWEDPNGPTALENHPGLLSIYNSSGLDYVTLMSKCLFENSLLRLYRTGACTHLYRSEEDEDFDVSLLHVRDITFTDSKNILLQLSYLYQDENDYALSKDTHVALWQAYRAYTHQLEVVEAFDFMIVNSLLHNQFDDFKKSENIDLGNSYLEMNSLLHFYIRQHPQLGTSLTEKYNKTYVMFSCDQVDELCQWIYTMREQHNSELSKVSHKEGSVELQLAHLQPTDLPLDSPPPKRIKCNPFAPPPCPESRKVYQRQFF